MMERTQSSSDDAWRHDGERNGWVLPPAAPWPFQLIIVRHIRAMYHERRLEREAKRLKAQGIGFGLPSQRDLWALYAIIRGWR